MPLILGLALYFVIWWTFLFAVLPFGVQSQLEAKDIVPGSDPLVWGAVDIWYVTYFLPGLGAQN